MKSVKSFLVLFTAFILIVSFSACKKHKNEIENIWESAVYTENTSFGDGKRCFELEVKADDGTVTFTINTDRDNLEEALLEHKLIEGEKGAYGLYVKKVNGMTADYDTDQSYWALSENGKPSATGARGAEIKGGEHFEFTYTK